MPKRVRHKKIQAEARRSPRRDAGGRTVPGGLGVAAATALTTILVLVFAEVLPERIWLLDHRNTLVNEARLLWRRDDVAGLELLDHCGLDPATNPLLGLLMSVWSKKGRPSNPIRISASR